MSLNCATTADCTPSDCVDGMQPNGFRLSTMCAALRSSSRCSSPTSRWPSPPARELVVVRMRQPRQLALGDQLGARVAPSARAERDGRSAVERLRRRRAATPSAQLPARLAHAALAAATAAGCARTSTPRRLCDPMRAPGAAGTSPTSPIGSDEHLGPLALEELEHPEVAVALGGLRPELAGDLDDRLHAQAIDLDGVEPLAAACERVRVNARRTGARGSCTSMLSDAVAAPSFAQTPSAASAGSASRVRAAVAHGSRCGQHVDRRGERGPCSPATTSNGRIGVRSRSATSASWNAFSTPSPRVNGELQARVRRAAPSRRRSAGR